LDAGGLMGQIVEVQKSFSRAILISDASHAIPVEVNRNGVRSVLRGLGRLDILELLHVPATTDIQVGDMLVSSGLGQRFPRGYPVATVTSVTSDPGKPFASITASPTAELNRSRHVLLLFTAQSVLQSEAMDVDN
jgi:rod shape-determining protein MreC